MKTFVNHLPPEITAAALGALASALTLGCIFGFAMLMQRNVALHAPAQIAVVKTGAPPAALVEQGRHLFSQNCAHCHGEDARGDEGPDLHGVRKSDARITAIIQKGIKGEMPKFGQKFHDDDVRALIAFVRSLKD